MAKDKKEGGGNGGGGIGRVIIEGGIEALTAFGLKELMTRLTGTPATTPPAAGTPGAPAAPGFDIGAAARDVLGPARRAELNTYAAQREAELNNAAAALRSLEEDE